METSLTFNVNQKLGEIVAAFPGASNLFKAYGLDFCCGGSRVLEDALRDRGIPAEPFLEELQSAYEAYQRRIGGNETDWRVAPYSELISRIITVHHDYLKQELPLLSQFVTKIAEVHAARHPELATLSEQFHAFKAELESHLLDEEKHVFPRILTFELTGNRDALAAAVNAVDELEAEHAAAGQLLFAMRELTKDYTVPCDACQTYAVTFQKLQELESDMFNHIHLENNILFPRIRREFGE